MSTKERAKAAERGIKNGRALINRQRRNLRAYVKVIHSAKAALEANDSLRALALLSGNIKYPPALLKDMTDCDHDLDTKFRAVCVCNKCGEIVEEDNLNG